MSDTEFLTSKNTKASDSSEALIYLHLIGAPGGIRTPDLLIRSQTLYPTELRAHIFGGATQI